MKKTAHKVHKKGIGLKSLKAKVKKLLPRRWVIPALTAAVVTIITGIALTGGGVKSDLPQTDSSGEPETVLEANNLPLPIPDYRSSNSVEAVLRSRREYREFIEKELSIKQISQLLWAAQGIIVDWGGRTAPSAKSVFPLSVYLVASKVTGLEAGQYQYIPGDRTPIHQLKPIKKVELQQALFETMNLSFFRNAPAVLIVTGNMNKMAEAYGGIPHDREVYLEAGHVGQNILLQAESLKLVAIPVASFTDTGIKDLVTIPASENIIYLIPIGYPKL